MQANKQAKGKQNFAQNEMQEMQMEEYDEEIFINLEA